METSIASMAMMRIARDKERIEGYNELYDSIRFKLIELWMRGKGIILIQLIHVSTCI